MTSHRHRVTCVTDGCGRTWRENCAECAEDTAAKHRAETGHTVELTVTAAEPDMASLRRMTRRAHQVLFSPKRGW